MSYNPEPDWEKGTPRLAAIQRYIKSNPTKVYLWLWIFMLAVAALIVFDKGGEPDFPKGLREYVILFWAASGWIVPLAFGKHGELAGKARAI